MNKYLILVSILLIAILIAGCGPVEVVPAEEKIKIGVVTPLTGDASNFGEWTQEGLELAKDEINAKGGVNGKQIELIYEDGKCMPKEALNAIQKLITVDKVSVVIGEICSSATLTMASVAEEAQIILMSTASSSPKITDAGDYVFRNWPSDIFEAGAMAEFANKKGYKTAAIIYVNNDYGLGLRDIFNENFDGNIVAIESYEQESADFRTQLTKIKSANPDSIFIGGYTNEIARIVTQIKEIGLDAQTLSVSTAESEEALGIAGDALEGLYYSSFAIDEARGEAKGYQERFQAKYGKQSEIFAATAYDALKIIAQAMENGIDSETIKNALYSTKNFPGVSGITTFDENGDVAKPPIIKTVKEGKFIKLGE